MGASWSCAGGAGRDCGSWGALARGAAGRRGTTRRREGSRGELEGRRTVARPVLGGTGAGDDAHLGVAREAVSDAARCVSSCTGASVLDGHSRWAGVASSSGRRVPAFLVPLARGIGPGLIGRDVGRGPDVSRETKAGASAESICVARGSRASPLRMWSHTPSHTHTRWVGRWHGLHYVTATLRRSLQRRHRSNCLIAPRAHGLATS